MWGLGGPQPPRSPCRGPPPAAPPGATRAGMCSPPAAGQLLWDTRLSPRAPREGSQLPARAILRGPGTPETPLLPVWPSQISSGPAGGHACLHSASLRRQAADQLPPRPRTAPPASRAPGRDPEADTTPALMETALPIASAAGRRLLGKGWGARPASPAVLPLQHVSSGDGGRAGLRLSVDWKRNWRPGCPREGSATHKTKPN